MIQYNPVAETIEKDGKPFKRGTKAWESAVWEYICNQVGNGKALVDVLPTESGALPDYLEFHELLTQVKFRDMYNQACERRTFHLRETFISVANKFAKGQGNTESIEWVKKVFDTILKSEKSNTSTTINFYSNLPDDMWK